MTVAPSGIRTDARGPTALMRDPLTNSTASGSGGPPFPSMTVQPTMASMAPWEPGALDATRLTVSASPSRHNNFPLDIYLLRVDIKNWQNDYVLYSFRNDWTELAAEIIAALSARIPMEKALDVLDSLQ